MARGEPVFTDDEIEQLRVLIESILEARGVKKVPPDLSDKRRLAARRSWEARRQKAPEVATENAFAMQNAPRVKRNNGAAPRAFAMQSASSTTWDAYSMAYQARYGAAPIRNSTVNSQLKALVGRLGPDEAPQVAAFYCSHNGSFYVAKGHATGPLLHDAEKLRTEWATGKITTSAGARDMDRQQEVVSVVDRVLAKAAAAGELK